jgi:uncharacterized protein (TIGR03437 family)
LPDYLYLLPNAFNLAAAAPPQLTGVISNSDGSVTVNGSGFNASTAVYFDSLPGSTVAIDTANQAINVVPPAGASAQIASLTAFNSDGQNSSLLLSGAPLTYSYASLNAPALSVSPNQLPAGAEASVDIQGVNTNFVAGKTVFAFGSHDIVVQRTWVLSPTHAIVDLGIPANAAQPLTEVTAFTDFQIATAPGAFQVTAQQAGLPAPFPILYNGVAGQTGSWAGAIVSMYGANLQASSNATPSVTINGQAASLLYVSPSQINLQVPSELSPGPATLLFSNGAVNAFPITVNIDLPEPIIQSITSAGTPVSSSGGVAVGTTIDAIVSGFAATATSIDPSRVLVSIGGVQTNPISVTLTTAGLYDVQFAVPSTVTPGSQLPLVLYLDGQSSAQASITITQ